MKKKRFLDSGITGAFFFWIAKGFENSLNDEMSDSFHTRNVIVSIIIWVIAFYILSRSGLIH